jgi:hypothetical protein
MVAWCTSALSGELVVEEFHEGWMPE